MFDKDPLKFSYLYLRNITNARPFKFINLGTLAYIGESEAVAKVQIGDSGVSVTSSGYSAFLLWYD
jgi:NADH dehydrogenase FAD-containing subunit